RIARGRARRKPVTHRQRDVRSETLAGLRVHVRDLVFHPLANVVSGDALYELTDASGGDLVLVEAHGGGRRKRERVTAALVLLRGVRRLVTTARRDPRRRVADRALARAPGHAALRDRT